MSRERCCVKMCNSTSNKNKDLSFHLLPKPKKETVFKTNYFGAVEAVDRLSLWKKALKLESLHPRMRVCSLHFKHDDYVLPDFPCRYRKLVKSAVPSVNLPLTKNEKRNFKNNEARLDRIIKRTVVEQFNHKLVSSENDVQVINMNKECKMKVAKQYDFNKLVSSENNVEVVDTDMNEECETKVAEQYKCNEPVSSESDVQIILTDIKEECNVVIASQPTTSSASEALQNEDPVIKLIEKNKNKIKDKVVNYRFIDTLNIDEKLCTATGITEIKILDTIVKMIKEVHGDKFEKFKLKTRDRIVLTYMKMKHNLSYRLLALIFNCTSAQLCQKIFLKTIQVLNNILSVAIPWPRREEISKNLPICFEGFEDTRVVLDCTEIFIQQPKNLCCQLKTYSQYKGATTVKFLIGVSPAGLITFVSPAYGGRTSDTAIFSQSKLINLLESGDGIMVDRGFLIDELCHKNRWKCIRPPFLHDKKQFSQSQSLATSKIAAARVHIERANQRIKVWSIIGSKMPVNLVPVASEILNVLCATVNISDPILSDDKFMDIN